jgi:hypothetical protein
VIQLLQQIPVDRALLVVFLAGQLYSQFKGVRTSLRLQGVRVGELEKRVAALEALGKRAG